MEEQPKLTTVELYQVHFLYRIGQSPFETGESQYSLIKAVDEDFDSEFEAEQWIDNNGMRNREYVIHKVLKREYMRKAAD